MIPRDAVLSARPALVNLRAAQTAVCCAASSASSLVLALRTAALAVAVPEVVAPVVLARPVRRLVMLAACPRAAFAATTDTTAMLV